MLVYTAAVSLFLAIYSMQFADKFSIQYTFIIGLVDVSKMLRNILHCFLQFIMYSEYYQYSIQTHFH